MEEPTLISITFWTARIIVRFIELLCLNHILSSSFSLYSLRSPASHTTAIALVPPDLVNAYEVPLSCSSIQRG